MTHAARSRATNVVSNATTTMSTTTTTRARSSRRTRARFIRTAIALLACAGCADDASPRLSADDDVELCRKQLTTIYAGLLEYERAHHAAPSGSGAAFLGALVDDGVNKGPWPRTEVTARVLSCPGVDPARLCSGTPAAQWFAPPRGACTAYAARDQAKFPLPAFPMSGSEPLVACDNELGPNHARYTNVLCADGSIVTLDLEQLKADGALPTSADRIPIGADAPASVLDGALRKLSRD